MGLLDHFLSKPKTGGMVGDAARDLSGRGYQLYAQEQKAQNLPALPYEQWVKAQKGG